MKKIIVSLVAALSLLCVSAWGAALPKNFVVGSSSGEEPAFVVNSADRTVTISLPLTQGQMTTDKSSERITDPSTVSVCLSEMYVAADGSKWILDPKDDYCGQGQSSVSGGMITRTFKVPQIGDGVNYALRIWGQSGSKWLWINQSSQFHRPSQNGSPAYEVLIDLRAGTASPVSKDLAVRP